MNQVERKRIDDAERWVAVQGGQEWRVGAPSDVPARRGWSDAARTGRAADEPRGVQAVAIQPRSEGPARHGRSAVVRRGAAGARRSGAARPESGGLGRRGRSAAAWGGALSAVAPRGDLVLRPLPWLLASWPGGGTAPAALAPGYWRRPSLGWRRLGKKPGGRER